MVNAPLFTTLNQMPAVSGIPFRVAASETWYKHLPSTAVLTGADWREAQAA